MRMSRLPSGTVRDPGKRNPILPNGLAIRKPSLECLNMARPVVMHSDGPAEEET